MTTRAVIIQHHPVETLAGNFTGVLRDAGFALTTVPVFESAPDFAAFSAPDLSETDLIVSLGGPMSANDNYPALIQEMAYLREAATGNLGSAAPTPVIGICLGAQLLSRALGGAVAPTGGYQFGLRKIDVTADGAADPVFSEIKIPLVPTLHGEQFTIPPNAVRLAEWHNAPARWRLRPFPYGISLRPVLRIPVRAATDIGRTQDLEPRTGPATTISWATASTRPKNPPAISGNLKRSLLITRRKWPGCCAPCCLKRLRHPILKSCES